MKKKKGKKKHERKAGTKRSGALWDAIRRYRGEYIAIALQESAGNVTRAAAELGITRIYLHMLMRTYGLKGRGRRLKGGAAKLEA